MSSAKAAVGLEVPDLRRVLDSVSPADSTRWLYDRKRPGMPIFPPEVPDSIFNIQSREDMWKLQETIAKYSVHTQTYLINHIII